MTNKAKKEFVVAHPRFTLMVDGKMTHVPKGSKVMLTAEAAEKAGKRLVCANDKPAVEVGKKEK